MRKIDLIGRKFGRWTVVAVNVEPRHCLCKCDCGTEKAVKRSNLLNGCSNSCGCIRKESLLPEGEAAANSLYAMYRCSAAIRKHSWELDKPTFKGLIKSDCQYCGEPPSKFYKPAHGKGAVFSGVDRRKNEEGYTINNSVPCCAICNQAKHTMSEADFRSWIGRVYAHMFETQEDG